MQRNGQDYVTIIGVVPTWSSAQRSTVLVTYATQSKDELYADEKLWFLSQRAADDELTRKMRRLLSFSSRRVSSRTLKVLPNHYHSLYFLGVRGISVHLFEGFLIWLMRIKIPTFVVRTLAFCNAIYPIPIFLVSFVYHPVRTLRKNFQMSEIRLQLQYGGLGWITRGITPTK